MSKNNEEIYSKAAYDPLKIKYWNRSETPDFIGFQKANCLGDILRQMGRTTADNPH